MNEQSKTTRHNAAIPTDQAILSAAEELFLEKGYLLASTTKIAAKAGVTHAMLHYYYRSKEQIFFKVMDKNVAELREAMRDVMNGKGSFWDTLKDGVEMHFDFINRHRRIPAMIYDVARQSPELLARYKETGKRMIQSLLFRHKQLLSEEIAAGRVNDVDFEQLFFDVVQMNVGTFLTLPMWQRVLSMDEQEIDDFLQRRKTEIIETLRYRLYGRIDTEKRE